MLWFIDLDVLFLSWWIAFQNIIINGIFLYYNIYFFILIFQIWNLNRINELQNDVDHLRNVVDEMRKHLGLFDLYDDLRNFKEDVSTLDQWTCTLLQSNDSNTLYLSFLLFLSKNDLILVVDILIKWEDLYSHFDNV
jgi:hypothetical protein